MYAKLFFLGRLAVIITTFFFASSASAEWIDIVIPYSKFGHLKNAKIDGHGACAATSLINSFWYLQNEFPNIYTEGHKLIPDGDLEAARDALHRKIWDNSNGTYKEIWEQKIKWFELYDAPGIFKGMVYTPVIGWYKNDGLIGNTYPTWEFLLRELKHGEDIEIVVKNPTFHHALTLTSLHFNDKNNNDQWDEGEERKIDYLDSNHPESIIEKDLWENTDGSLGWLFNNNVCGVWITAAYSESAPEPATVTLFVVGFFMICLRRYRGKHGQL